MNKRQKRRLVYVVLFLLGLGIAAGLMLLALKQNINVFVTPTEAKHMALHTNYTFRLGGMVKKNSVQRDPHSLNMQFVITDFHHDILVHYKGILPDLFHEGKGVIVEGQWTKTHVFLASRVLAKHDENYMPRKNT